MGFKNRISEFGWSKLPRPFFILAPMEDVTDTVFRQIVAMTAKPDVFVTEFTNCDGLVSAGSSVVKQRLKYTQTERPLIAQVWGKNPDNFYKAAQVVAGLGFDGIDINMGCPQRKVIKSGCGGALIGNHELAAKLISATRKGLADCGKSDIPISVKTRIGVREITTASWMEFLLSQNLEAVTVHGRTVSEQSETAAHWDEIGLAVKLRDGICPQTVIIGNGDVKDAVDAQHKYEKYGVDGVMIGRGVFRNLWVFDRTGKHQNSMGNQKLLRQICLKHLQLFQETWGGNKNFQIMKKYFKIYIQDFAGAGHIRQILMTTQSYEEAKRILEELAD